MDHLTRRVRRDYAAGISCALVLATLCLGFIAFAIQARNIEAQARETLQFYVARAQQEPRITTKQQVAQLIAGTTHPNWTLSVAEGDTRYIVRWPPGTIESKSRAVPLPETPGLINGSARIAGLRDSVAIVNGAELRVLPGWAIVAVAYRTLFAVAILAVLELLLAAMISKPLAHRALRPLHTLHDALTHMAETGLFSHRLPEPQRDDLSGLIRAYNSAIDAATNAMAERDAAEERTRQFISDAGHQLRTPLTVLSGFVGILRRGHLRSPDDGPLILEKMEAQIEIIRKLVERLMLLEGWSTEQPSCENVDIGEFVRTVVEPVAISKPERTIHITTAANANACIDRSELTYAITNIVANALKYAPDSAVMVDVSTEDGKVNVTVSDDGPGIPPDELPHIFDRFYRGSRRDVPGSGLGLAIAKTAVERAGGTISVKTEPGKGATFTITMPRVPSTVSAIAAV